MWPPCGQFWERPSWVFGVQQNEGRTGSDVKSSAASNEEGGRGLQGEGTHPALWRYFTRRPRSVRLPNGIRTPKTTAFLEKGEPLRGRSPQHSVSTKGLGPCASQPGGPFSSKTALERTVTTAPTPPFECDPSSNGGRVKFWVSRANFSSNIGNRMQKGATGRPGRSSLNVRSSAHARSGS